MKFIAKEKIEIVIIYRFTVDEHQAIFYWL